MTFISKEQYLQRYLKSESGAESKNKNKIAKGKWSSGIRIVDDDILWSKLTSRNKELPEELLLKEEKPQIAEVDERTEKEKALDMFRRSNKWITIEKTKLDAEDSVLKPEHRYESDCDMDVPRSSNGINISSESDLEVHRLASNPEDLSSLEKKVHPTSAGLSSLAIMESKECQKTETNIDYFATMSQKTETIFRQKGGKKRDLDYEKRLKKVNNEEKQKKKAKYDQWGKGLIQTEMKEYALEDLIHEANKPLARYADDVDLDKFQRSQIRDGDPMAGYLSKKTKLEKQTNLRKYGGPPPAPNRFHILPGFRWDGVDRSNGFEERLFSSQSESGTLRQEAYKWSVEDM